LGDERRLVCPWTERIIDGPIAIKTSPGEAGNQDWFRVEGANLLNHCGQVGTHRLWWRNLQAQVSFLGELMHL